MKIDCTSSRMQNTQSFQHIYSIDGFVNPRITTRSTAVRDALETTEEAVSLIKNHFVNEIKIPSMVAIRKTVKFDKDAEKGLEKPDLVESYNIFTCEDAKDPENAIKIKTGKMLYAHEALASIKAGTFNFVKGENLPKKAQVKAKKLDITDVALIDIDDKPHKTKFSILISFISERTRPLLSRGSKKTAETNKTK